tara:strand:+ start:59 stop:472 length:414 start_codon:yes stop_codon:yes gene_type:complete
MLFRQSKSLHHSGIVSTGEITPPVSSTGEITPRYSHYLCFTVSERNNRLGLVSDHYSPEQEETVLLIQSLQEKGMGYRKIAQYLNQNGIRTSKGNEWLNTQVYSVLKRFRERQERLELIETEYPIVWGKMRIEWMKN